MQNEKNENRNKLLKYSDDSFKASALFFLTGFIALLLINTSFLFKSLPAGVLLPNLTGIIFYAFFGISLILIGCTFVVCGFWCRIKAIEIFSGN